MKKELTVDVLYYRTLEARDGTVTKIWFTTSLQYRIYNEAPYVGDYLSLFQSYHKTTGWAVKVFHKHFVNDDVGYATQELSANDEREGISIKRTKNIELSNEEFLEKYNSHKYRVLKEDGNRLVLPPLAEYTLG